MESIPDSRDDGSIRVVANASERCIEVQDMMPDKAVRGLDRILAPRHEYD